MILFSILLLACFVALLGGFAPARWPQALQIAVVLLFVTVVIVVLEFKGLAHVP